MKQFTGWLLDLYAHPKNGVVLWLLCDDGTRQFFFQDFETTFYVRGPFLRLRELWRFLRSKPVQLDRVERDDLYDGPQQVMEVRVASPNLHARIFREAQNTFPDLIYYDVDIALSLRYAAAFNIFPMARCKITVKQNKVEKITALDSPWDIDPLQPPLRKLVIKPNVDPAHATPEHLLIRYNKFKYRAPLNKPRDLLFLLNGIFRSYNPDVILTRYGDTWLFNYLEELSKQTSIPFNPNRDLSQGVIKKKPISFFNYGRAHYRGEQVHLLGRWHIDVMNCMSYSEYGLAGAMEEARITGLPVQEAARRSAGAGISAMQVLTALRRGVLVPYERQKGEVSKTYNQLFKMDRGGLIFEPLLGVFKNVAILDFMMMYPSIMVEFNLSPETVGVDEVDAWDIPGLGVRVSNRRGLIPETLEPMVKKRITIKRRLKTMGKDHVDYRRYKSYSNVMKNLGIVSNGRMGYANSIFGRITAYETISYISRKIILQAKAIAENHGFTVLHVYVDSLFLCREDATTPADFKAVMDEIEAVTKLPINLEDVHPWMAFVSSRRSSKIPVSNRFFGSKSDGGLKVRGLIQRRRDTCTFVADVQKEALNMLAQEKDPAKLIHLLPDVIDVAKEKCSALQNGEIPLEKLVITRTLSRELNEYRVSSALLAAATQLNVAGRVMHMGQQVRYLHTRGQQRSYPWDLPIPPKFEMVDVDYYKELILRAIFEVVQPLGVTKGMLKDWVRGASYILPSDLAGLSPKEQIALELPLFANLNHLRLDTL